MRWFDLALRVIWWASTDGSPKLIQEIRNP